jgi:uncharacterized protein YbjT (DUF2867 family)
MQTSTILVAGATGLLGNEICRQLRAKNLPVKAMVRTTTDPVKIEHLTKLGVQVVQGDLQNKESLSQMLQGVTTVITTVSAMPFSYKPGENDIQLVDENGTINLIDASKSAGVKHFIYTSVPLSDLKSPLSKVKTKVEGHLQKCGLTYTILRPNFFMEVWLTAAVGFDVLNGKVNICGDGKNPVAYISFKDVSKFVVESISNPASKNAILELGGPKNISQLDVVKIFEEALHKKIEVQHVPVEALQAQFSGATDGMQKSFSGLMLDLAKGIPNNMEDILKTFPIKLTSVEEYVRSIAPAS